MTHCVHVCAGAQVYVHVSMDVYCFGSNCMKTFELCYKLRTVLIGWETPCCWRVVPLIVLIVRNKMQPCVKLSLHYEPSNSCKSPQIPDDVWGIIRLYSAPLCLNFDVLCRRGRALSVFLSDTCCVPWPPETWEDQTKQTKTQKWATGDRKSPQTFKTWLKSEQGASFLKMCSRIYKTCESFTNLCSVMWPPICHGRKGSGCLFKPCGCCCMRDTLSVFINNKYETPGESVLP